MEDYVTFEQAKKLKELGFDWECDFIYYFTYHNHDNPVFGRYETTDHYEVEKYWYAPTQALTQKWLREKKGICVTSNINIHKGKYKFNWNITLFKEGRGVWDENVIYDTYEQALSSGIDRVLELLN